MKRINPDVLRTTLQERGEAVVDGVTLAELLRAAGDLGMSLDELTLESDSAYHVVLLTYKKAEA